MYYFNYEGPGLLMEPEFPKTCKVMVKLIEDIIIHYEIDYVSVF